jgi:hypothetical protein
VLEGAAQVTGSWLSWLDWTVTAVGALGTVAGVPATAGDEAGPVPTSLEAVTVTEYVSPFVTAWMVHEVAGAVAVQERGLFPGVLAVAV